MADVRVNRERILKEIDAALHGKERATATAGFELNQRCRYVIGAFRKGGVGKSFVTGILLLTLLAQESVGILDLQILLAHLACLVF